MTMAASGAQVKIKVTIDMSTRPRLGVEANGDNGRTLILTSIGEGAIKNWNDHCTPSQVVQPGDQIISANGVSGDSAKIIQACQNSKKELKLVVEGKRNDDGDSKQLAMLAKKNDSKPEAYTWRGDPPAESKPSNDPEELGTMKRIRVNLNVTSGLRLGIEACPSPDGAALTIITIQEPGVVLNWNLMVSVDKQLCIGDKILSINGVSRDTSAMIQQCKIASHLHMVVEGLRSKRDGGPILMPNMDQRNGPVLAQLPAPEYLEEKAKEAELQMQREEQAVKAENSKHRRESREPRQPVKKGPGVAALVSGALKRAQEQKKDSKEGEDEEDKNATEESAEEKRQKEAQEKLKREAERKKAKDEARKREAQVREAVEEARKKAKVAAEAESLYTQMPEPDLEQEAASAAQARVRETQSLGRASKLPPEDRSKVIFLDVDGVLRPAKTGGFESVAIDGAHAVKVDTSDFFKTALEALRLVVVKTGASIVLSSEWRRDDTLKTAVDEILTKNGIRPVSGCTTTALDRDRSIGDVQKSQCERRAREISEWLQRHESSVREWVVIDDVNLALADEHRQLGTKAMAPRLVLTVPLFGFTMGNAKTTIRVLQGEVIQKRIVSNSFPVMPTDKEDIG
eukprot:gnl/MRDRNA2_/MRDRNA2_112710_c0_seq1.p1 gnl/MRDRNA2_/MRDRNA2_112710_c0~~gnl/MRDRNA2_/MRDRNA2_112710_c0_seq1.p1  ORF type:complete len:628 (+),score=152.41 gnl/MRDRNA2_/MRDRNA2_112710_c0_seq1:153-2036(+)